MTSGSGPVEQLRSFKISFLVIFLLSFFSFVIQKLHPDFSNPISGGVLLTVFILTAVATLAYFFRLELYTVLTSYHFSVLTTGVTGAGTIAGKLILQNLSTEEYVTLYGPAFTRFLQFFYLNDLFHSLWFATLLVVLTASLLLVFIQRTLSHSLGLKPMRF